MKQGISLPQIPKNLITDNKELYDYLFGLQQALLSKQTDDYSAVDKTSSDLTTAKSDLTTLTTAFNDYVDDYVDYSSINLASGYIDFKNGLQLRWGSFVSNTDDDQTVTFASAFSTGCLSIVTSLASTIISKSASNFIVNRLDSVNGTPTAHYIAIGY